MEQDAGLEVNGSDESSRSSSDFSLSLLFSSLFPLNESLVLSGLVSQDPPSHSPASERPASLSLTRIFLLAPVILTILSSCNHSPKKSQYLVQGQRLYESNCANCHQADGKGLGRLYPPMEGSDYLRDSTEAVICLIKNGISGPLMVNGIVYDQPMPGNQKLTDLEVAELVTYVRMKWAGAEQMTETRAVRKTLDNCGQVN